MGLGHGRSQTVSQKVVIMLFDKAQKVEIE